MKGIGSGTADNLKENGIDSINDLIATDPEDLACKISGVSSKRVVEWQNSAKALIKT